MRRERVIIGGLVGAIVLTGALALVLSSRGSSSDDERSSPPSSRPGSNEAVAAYLAGPGRLVSDFRDISGPLLELGRTDDVDERYAVCEPVALQLDERVDPDALYVAAVGIPDPVLAELSLDERSARSSLLVACGDRDAAGVDAALEAARAADELFRERLDEDR